MLLFHLIYDKCFNSSSYKKYEPNNSRLVVSTICYNKVAKTMYRGMHRYNKHSSTSLLPGAFLTEAILFCMYI